MHNTIQAHAKALGIATDVALLGFQETPFPWISRAEVFVLSSHHEGFGNIVVETMAAAITQLLDDPQLRDNLGANGKERAAYFSIARMANSYQHYFLSLLGQ